MARNYYVILGVAPDASADQIKSAYRRKAKELHPDHYEGSSKPFRDVQEAYEALSDPARRETYDAECARAQRHCARERRARAAPVRPTSCPVEPLIPNAPPVGKSTVRGRSLHLWPGERMDRLRDQVDRWFWPTSQALGPDPVTIPLSLTQAQRGGRVRIWLALPAPCPSCWGYGGVGFYECAHCAGQGTIVEQRPVWLSFPAGVADRSEARVSLAQLGMPDVYLVVRFRVRGP